MQHGIYVDTNIKDISQRMAAFLLSRGLNHVTLRRNVHVEGRSWEMAAAMGALDFSGVYSGVISEYVPDVKIIFGPVPAIKIKKKLYTNLITSDDVPQISLSR